MYCQWCGTLLPPGAESCPHCAGPGATGSAAGSVRSDSVDQLVADAKHAAKDLAVATARLSKRLLSKAEVAAQDPSGSAKKAARRAAKELDRAAEELDQLLRKL